MNRPETNNRELRPGDTVGVVATGFAVDPDQLEAGASRLRQMGYRVVLGDHVFDRAGYFAGKDDDRAADLVAMLDRSDVRAVWFARGGYGTSRVLDRVSFESLRSRPKILVGYSDLTCLFGPAIDRSGLVCLYGPIVTELADPSAWDEASLVDLLGARPVDVEIPDGGWITGGAVRGRLAGGNLTVLTHMIGTRWEPDVRDAVLFLEDIGEEAYRVDRMLTQLDQAGWLERVSGVLLGCFGVPETQRAFPPDRPVDEVLRERLAPLGVPVATGVPAGHCPGKWTVPLGGAAEIDAGAGRVRLIPGP